MPRKKSLADTKQAVEALKRVNVPFWARWLGEYRAWKRAKDFRLKQQAECDVEKEKFRHIATVHLWTRWTDTGNTDCQFFICEENGFGERRFEYGATSDLIKKKNCHDTWLYARVVRPWMLHSLSNQVIQEYARKTRTCDEQDKHAKG